MKRNKAIFLSLICSCFWSVPSVAQVEISPGGDASYQVCAACHGIDGNSRISLYPSLAGRSTEYLQKQLHDFKVGRRENAIMQGLVVTLSDDDIVFLSNYYAAMIPVEGKTSADLETMKLGEKIFRGGNMKTGVSACMSCHGPSGHGLRPWFPWLAGQHAAYLQNQLLEFKNGIRTNDHNGMMSSITFRMSLREIQAVSEYISSLK